MDTMTDKETQAQQRGMDAGNAAANWVWDGNTTTETYRMFLKSYDEGTLDEAYLAPYPLSGEWAGESITELLGDLLTGNEDSDLEVMDYYEVGFVNAWYDNLITTAKYMTQEDTD